MISQRKRLMWVIEAIGLASGTCSLLLGGMALAGLVEPQSLSVLVLPEMLVTFAVFFVGILLVSEYSKLARAGRPWWQRARRLNWAEMAQLTIWCPLWLKWVAPAVMVASVASLYPGGRVSWTPGDPFERRHLGLIIGPTLFIFISLPVIASARRMSGSYSESLPQPSAHDA